MCNFDMTLRPSFWQAPTPQQLADPETVSMQSKCGTFPEVTKRKACSQTSVFLFAFSELSTVAPVLKGNEGFLFLPMWRSLQGSRLCLTCVCSAGPMSWLNIDSGVFQNRHLLHESVLAAAPSSPRLRLSLRSCWVSRLCQDSGFRWWSQ